MRKIAPFRRIVKPSFSFPSPLLRRTFWSALRWGVLVGVVLGLCGGPFWEAGFGFWAEGPKLRRCGGTLYKRWPRPGFWWGRLRRLGWVLWWAGWAFGWVWAQGASWQPALSWAGVLVGLGSLEFLWQGVVLRYPVRLGSSHRWVRWGFRLSYLGVWGHLLGGEAAWGLLSGIALVGSAEGSKGAIRLEDLGEQLRVVFGEGVVLYVDKSKSFDVDVVMVLLRLLEDAQGRPIFTLQQLAEGFGLQARQNVDLRMAKYRQAGESLLGLVPSHKKPVLTERVRTRIVQLWTGNPFLTVEQMRRVLLGEGILELGRISPKAIREAVRAVDFHPIRENLKRRLARGEAHLSRDYLLGRLEELVGKLLERGFSYPGLSASERVELEQIQEMVSLESPTLRATKRACLCDFLFGRVSSAGVCCPHCASSHTGRKTGQAQRVQVQRGDGIVQTVEVFRHYCYNSTCPVGSFVATAEGEWVYSEEMFLRKFLGFRLYMSLRGGYRTVSSTLSLPLSTAYGWVQLFCEDLLDVASVFGGVRPVHTVGVDDKWVKAPKHDKPRKGKCSRWMYVHFAVDPFTYDLLHIDIFKENDAQAARLFLLALKAKGYRPRVFVTDGAPAYAQAIEEVFPQAIHHICIFHALQSVGRKLREVYGADYEQKHPEVEALKLKIYRIFRAKDPRTVQRRFEEVLALKGRYGKACPEVRGVFESLAAQFPKLKNAVGKAYIPNTNNATELVIRRFDQHYQNFCGFDSLESARRVLWGFALVYRLTPLSQEVKDRSMRGRCPLEIAGYPVRHLPVWKYLNTPLLFQPGQSLVGFSP